MRTTVLIFVLVAVSSTAAGAATPGSNGLIAYQREVNGTYQLFTIHSDGKGNRQLTHLTGGATHPNWAPDGKLIAFTKEKPPADASVAVIAPTGAGLREITPAPRHVWEGAPVFTPDGRSLVFVRQGPTDSGIWIIRVDGSGLRRLTKNPYARNGGEGDIAPSVSPDGKRVSFVRVKRVEKQEAALFTVGIDGTGLEQLTSYALDVASRQDWSPDGTLILLSTNAHFARPRASANLATIHPDGAHLKELTHFTDRKQNAYAGSFSPDGKQIVLRLERGASCRPTDAVVAGCTGAVAVVDRNGRNLRLLTSLSPVRPRYLAWGPHVG